MADPQAVESVSSTSQPNNPLSRKLNKVLETRLDNDKDMLEALKSLSVFFTENSLRSRRNLRGDIERRSLSINEEYAQCFKAVKEQLDSVCGDVKAMNDCCMDMNTRLKAAKDQTRDLINQTTQLQSDNQKLAMHAQVADAFLAKFQLSPEETKILRAGRETGLHPDFFLALAHVKQIHTDCKVLLRTNQQTAGLEIMESMAMHQESAYERLYRWTQNECRLLAGESIDVRPQLCEAMQGLYDRPVLFRYSLDEFGTARRTAIVRGFIDALTRGGIGGTPRPIELHAHDPLRYVGDMLAWLHQGTASEKDHLQALLKRCTGSAVETQIHEILNHVTEGVCRPLKVRVEQVLVSEPGAVTLYRLANLIQFYSGTLQQIMPTPAGTTSSLLATLDEMHSLCLKMFFNSLNCHAGKLMDKVELPPADLSPTSAYVKTVSLLRDVFSSQDSSVVALDTRKQDFQQILLCMVDPLVQMCSVSASSLSTVDMATYMINCLYQLQTTLALYQYTDHRLEMLQAQIDAHVDTLVSEQASFILGRAGLASMYGIVQQHQPKQGALSSMSGMDPASVKTAMAKFDSYLASPDSLLLSQFTLLQSSKLRESVKHNSVDLISHAYTQLYTAITNTDNKYVDPRTIVPRTPEQVKHLLS